jgi:peptidoglycan hydrolase-like protein with peptidoglycan-binding domain
MRRGITLSIGFAAVAVSFALAGCVTTATKKSETDIQTLKLQVSDLETKVQQKDAEIDGLRQALSKTTEEKYNQMKESAVATQVPSPLQIQKALQNAGFDPGEVDGKLGKQTRKAIRDFQKANGLTADGKVGPKTWSELAKFAEKNADKVQVSAVVETAQAPNVVSAQTASDKMQAADEKTKAASSAPAATDK